MSKKINGSSKGTSAGRTRDRSAVIMEILRSFPGKRYSLKNLASASGGNDREGRWHTKEILDQMIAEGSVVEDMPGKYRLGTSQLPSHTGIADMVSSGAVYVRVEGQEDDIYVDPRNAMHALDGDTVRVAVIRKRKNGNPEGEITEIIRRSDNKYVGRVELTRNHAFVRVDSRKMPVDIFLYTKDSGVKDGDKVVVRITGWDMEAKSPTGDIVDILGPAGDNNTEMHAILAEYGLPYVYPKEVEAVADRLSSEIPKEEYASRRDFRDIATFTIDPADAKDFDDALSVRKTADDRWEVGVHIADVTYYVVEGSIIEDEGRERATSVYLVDRTIPMLPEKISNELCSLRPNEEKLCFSAVFEIDVALTIHSQWLGRTIIRSDRRFSYEEAQQVIETGQGDFAEEMLTLNTLAQGMRRERFKNGAITFDREEAKFELDADGKPTGVYFKEMKESNQLIEEFMLLANKKVAEFAGRGRQAAGKAEDTEAPRGKGSARTFVYRVHDKPDPDKLDRFRNFILKFGYYFTAERGKEISREMNELMAEIKGKAEENVVSTLAIRTMAKAYYSTDNIGHYGLAFPYYTHFTAPIRRYPDIMVHRLLAHYLAGGGSPDKNTIEALCEHSSEMEVRAAEAERASVKYKMAEFMLDKVGQQFEGVISGVTERGVYVELKENHIEGMVAMRDLGEGFRYDEENYAVRSSQSGIVLTLGDSVQISVKGVDLVRKQVDFIIVATLDFETGKTRSIDGFSVSAGKGSSGASAGSKGQVGKGSSGKGRSGASASTFSPPVRKGRSKRK